MNETMEQMRARYPAAVADTQDVESMVLGTVLRPGELPRCRFDWPDGLRLIISRESWPRGQRILHVSASYSPNETLTNEMMGQPLAQRLDWFFSTVRARFQELSGDKRPLKFLGFSEGKNVPHWVIVEDGK